MRFNYKPSKDLVPIVENAHRPLLPLTAVAQVKATTENSPIRLGEPLTKSLTPSQAMRCAILKECEGRIVGNALEPLEEGMGLITMLVMR